MARMDTTGLDALIQDMERRGQLSGPVADRMVTAAVEEIKAAWQASAEKHGLRDTGALIDSIGFGKSNVHAGDIIFNDVYPQGTDEKGVRNATKAFILHYGKRGYAATYWVDDAVDMSAGPVQTRLEQIWNEFLNG